MMKIKLLILVFFMFSIAISAQEKNKDKIIKKTDDVINCKIDIVGEKIISYYFEDRPELRLEIDIYKVKEVILDNGEVLSFAKNNFEDVENYGSDSKNAIKIDFLSPLYGYTEFVFERSIKPGQSAEIAIGAIGLGKDLANNNPSGVFVKLGYKFMRTPDYYTNDMKYGHILKGAYIMPELGFRNHSKDLKDNNERKNITSYTFNIKFGKQWVFTDAFLVDWYLGAGYGYSDNDGENSGHYGFVTGSDDLPISFTAGLRIGLVFGK